MTQTKHFAVIGDPIKHSLSPVIYNTLFSYYGVDADYTRILVPSGGLSDLDAFVARHNLSGFNLTMPHKESVIPMLSHIDKSALTCRSVNTVAVREQAYFGWSTDAAGFARALSEAGIDYSGRDVLFLGAGGAARTLIPDAALRGARTIIVMARNQDKARAAAQLAGTACPHSYGGFSREDLESAASRCSLLINATPLGMEGVDTQFDSLSFLGCLKSGVPVCDLIYRPARTELLSMAQKKGHPIMNGLDMLIWQGLLAFGHYTGIEADLEAKNAVKKALEAELAKS